MASCGGTTPSGAADMSTPGPKVKATDVLPNEAAFSLK
jgi:hypothetical protein